MLVAVKVEPCYMRSGSTSSTKASAWTPLRSSQRYSVSCRNKAEREGARPYHIGHGEAGRLLCD